ncbi:MAG TPA: hypothetical protein VFG60_07120, partial [Burkholderiaceae bacterium]|nr:hypothetical protein [Burkholderiaceae bacterium]
VECGCELPEELQGQEFEANVWLLGDRVIKAALNPFDAKLRPFHFYLYERDETGVFGVGVASILRDTQTVFNAAVRATIDNAAMSAGPILEVNRSLLADGEDPATIGPRRVFIRTGTGEEARYPAVRSYVVANNVPMLLALAQAFKEMGDEASAIPAYIQGEGASEAGRTMGGLSMLMGAANITLKDTVANYDDGITKPVITALYHWNMQFHENERIKGNYEIVVRGSESLVAKEIRARQIAELLSGTANPVDSIYYDRAALNREYLRANELNDDGLMADEATVKQRQEARAKQPDPDLLKAMTDRMEAQAKAAYEQGKLELEARKMNIDAREQALEAREAELERLASLQEAQLHWGAPSAAVESGEYYRPPEAGNG